MSQFLLRVDGERIKVRHERAEIGETRDFPVPQKHLADRRIELTWDRPGGEGHLNWRQHSRLCEVWLLKQDQLFRFCVSREVAKRRLHRH